MKEIKGGTNRWRNYTMLLDWKTQYSESKYIIQSNL